MMWLVLVGFSSCRRVIQDVNLWKKSMCESHWAAEATVRQFESNCQTPRQYRRAGHDGFILPVTVTLYYGTGGQRTGELPHKTSYACSLFIQEHPHGCRVDHSVPQALQRDAPSRNITYLRPQQDVRNEKVARLE